MDAQTFKQFVLRHAADLPPDVGPVKTCKGCHEIKPETEFTWASGLGYFCKECSRKKLNAVKKHFQRRRSGARK